MRTRVQFDIGGQTSAPFDPAVAFSRTLGFTTGSEMGILKGKTVAIGGLGGVGGSHLLTLTRLGVGGFHIADFDCFEVENFNRQAGANLTTVGRKKIEVLSEMALQINPELRIKTFPAGLNAENLDQFLEGVDLYLDGLDFFAFDIRHAVFEACRRKSLPAVTVAPIGMGAALLNFLPGGMSFSDYFQWRDGDSDEVRAVKFLVGLAPSLPHRKYLVDPSAVQFALRKGPSTPMGCELSAGVAGTEALKILLGRGKVKSAPHSVHFDAFENRLYSRRVSFGNRNPIQKLKIAIAVFQMNRLILN